MKHIICTNEDAQYKPGILSSFEKGGTLLNDTLTNISIETG